VVQLGLYFSNVSYIFAIKLKAETKYFQRESIILLLPLTFFIHCFCASYECRIWLKQFFFTRWMVQPRVNETFVGVNGRREVNVGWMKFLYLSFVSSGNVLVFTQHISTIVNKMANFKRFNLTSTAVRNSARHENHTIWCS